MSSKRITCKGRVMAFLLAFATAMSSFPMTNVFADDDVDSTSVSSSSVGTDSVTVMLESGSGGTLKATLPDGTVYTSSENEENSFEMESGTKITLSAIPDQGYKVGVYQIDTADGEHYSEEGKDDGSPVTNRVTISEDAYVVANYEEISTESSSSSSSGSETDKNPVVDGSSTSSSSTSNSSPSDSSSSSNTTELKDSVDTIWDDAVKNGEKVTDKDELAQLSKDMNTDVKEGDVYYMTYEGYDHTEYDLYSMNDDRVFAAREMDGGTKYTIAAVGANLGLSCGNYLVMDSPTTVYGHAVHYCYVVNQSGDVSTGTGSEGRRYAFCMNQARKAPIGKELTWKSTGLPKEVLFVLANGPRLVGQRSVNSSYRVSYTSAANVPQWEAEVAAAQYAIHILVGDQMYDQMVGHTITMTTSTIQAWFKNNTEGQAIYNLACKFVNDARSANYSAAPWYYLSGPEFNNANKMFFRGNASIASDWGILGSVNAFYVTDSIYPAQTNDKLTIHKDWTVKDNGYITNYWYVHYDANFGDYKYYINTLNFDTSNLPTGSKIIRQDTSKYSGFAVWVPKSSYDKIAKNTTYDLKVTANVPGGLYAAYYASPDNDYQNMTWFSAGGGWHDAEFTVKLHIAQQVQPGNIKLIKKSTNTDLTDGKEGYSLEGAEYGVYEKQDCSGKASYTMTIKKDSKGTYTATVEDVPAGTWYVKETKAPKGYTLNSTVYPVDVPQNKTIEVPVEDNPITLTINLTKVSALPDCTNNNENYSLKGAVYTVYTDEKCKSPATKDGKNVTLTTDKNGKASVSGLPKGTYYIKETTVPNNWAIDSTVHTVDATSDGDASAGVISKTVTSKETPKLDPITILLKKTDSKGDAAKPLENARFVIKYYTKMMTTDPAAQGIKPAATWTFKTKKSPNGKYYGVRFDPAYLDTTVDNSPMYKNEDGAYAIPYGTITIKEQDSPAGYMLDSKLHVIRLDGTDHGISADTALTIPNNSVDFNIVKKQYGTDSVISGAVFKHTDPNGMVETVTTDKNGKASFRGLIDGKHIIEETYVDPAYFLNDHKIEFTVTGGQISKEGLDKLQFEASGTNGSIKVTANKEDGYDAVIEDKPAYYKLQMHKVNDVDTKLAGAEFTLYSDAACTKVLKKGTTDSNGILTMEQLTIGETYYLAETKAPNGYRLPLDSNGKPVVYTIKGDSSSKDNFAIVVNKKSYSGSSGEWYVSGSGSDRYAHFRVVNQRQAKLPNTGSHAMLIIVIAGLALVVGALVLERKNKKKK